MNTVVASIFTFWLLFVCINSHGSADDDSDIFCGQEEYTASLLAQSEEYAANYAREQRLAHDITEIMISDSNHDLLASMNGDERRRRLVDSLDISVANVRVPVVYHVMYTTEEENWGEDRLNEAIGVLNKAFRAQNDEIVNGEIDPLWTDRIGDTRVSFEMTDIIRTDISDIDDFQGLNYSVVFQDPKSISPSVDPHTYLNIWLCPLRPLSSAYTISPCALDTAMESQDGVVVDIGLPADEYEKEFEDYLIHSIGHYFNLLHIWGEGDCTMDDFINDTPLQDGFNKDCPINTTKNTCYQIDDEYGIDLRDQTENYMDFTDYPCKTMFTEQQAMRMRASLGPYGCRHEMYENGKYYECGSDLDECFHSPCAASETSECEIYISDSVGCSKCKAGYFMKDSNHACIDCSETFGDGCMFCQDEIGCGQCKNGYSRVYLEECGVYVCKENGGDDLCDDYTTNVRDYVDINACITPCDENNPFDVCDCSIACHCQVCHQGSGCSVCDNGYFKKGDNYPCVSCNEYFGDSCLHCQDGVGCGQCAQGCDLVYNSECGLYECDCGECSDGKFCCKDGCEIDESEVNDDMCNCPACDDEDDWSCESCYPFKSPVWHLICPSVCSASLECIG